MTLPTSAYDAYLALGCAVSELRGISVLNRSRVHTISCLTQAQVHLDRASEWRLTQAKLPAQSQWITLDGQGLRTRVSATKTIREIMAVRAEIAAFLIEGGESVPDDLPLPSRWDRLLTWFR